MSFLETSMLISNLSVNARLNLKVSSDSFYLLQIHTGLHASSSFNLTAVAINFCTHMGQRRAKGSQKATDPFHLISTCDMYTTFQKETCIALWVLPGTLPPWDCLSPREPFYFTKIEIWINYKNMLSKSIPHVLSIFTENIKKSLGFNHRMKEKVSFQYKVKSSYSSGISSTCTTVVVLLIWHFQSIFFRFPSLSEGKPITYGAFTRGPNKDKPPMSPHHPHREAVFSQAEHWIKVTSAAKQTREGQQNSNYCIAPIYLLSNSSWPNLWG